MKNKSLLSVIGSRGALVLAVFSATALLGSAYAEPASSNSLNVEHEQLETAQKHHYNSPAERAQDALLITEVKSALVEDGVTEGHAVEVDCDHGNVRLTGAVDSAADAKHAQQVASSVQGVRGVDNRLIWR